MTKKRELSLALLCWALLACSSNGPGSNASGAGAGTLNGIVTDSGTGARISAASVAGGGLTATTDAQGEFTLSGLSSGDVNLSITKAGYAPGYATGKAGDKAQAVLATLKKQGTLQSYDGTKAVTLFEKTEAGPYALIVQQNTLDTTDTKLKISITPLDPTKERAALPGSLITGGTTPSLLIPVTFAEFTILDSAGNRVNLKASASALVELPIPPSLRSAYPPGTKIHCYAYDPTTGRWQDFVEGTVQTSSVDGTSPVLAASIRHFSWYGGAPQGNNCVDTYVTVVSAVDGKPLGNARVEATPGTTAYTDASGSALVRTAVGNTFSTYTAYQTGFDVDGSLTGIKGAKYIEFGEVQEDVVGLVQKPCSSAIATASTNALAGTQSDPFVIKVGLVKNLLYEATAILSAGRNGSGGSLSVVLQQGVPGPDGKLVNPLPASGAKITLAQGSSAPVLLAELAAGSGFYAATGVSIVAGKSYSLAIDADGNGSIDGTSNVVAVGDLAWASPTDGATVSAANLTASWLDTGTSANNAGYAPVYQVIIAQSVASGTPDLAIYSGTDRQFAVKSAVSAGAPPLKPGTYTASLVGFSGFYAQATGGIQLSNNVTGTGVTGTFFSLGSAPTPITFTVQ